VGVIDVSACDVDIRLVSRVVLYVYLLDILARCEVLVDLTTVQIRAAL